jgi:hypothetical protein
MDDDLSDSSASDSGNEESDKKSSDEEIKRAAEDSKTSVVENAAKDLSVASSSKHEVAA